MATANLNAKIDRQATGHSTIAAQSHRLEYERVHRMSIEERVRAALTMDQRFSWIKPAPAGPCT